MQLCKLNRIYFTSIIIRLARRCWIFGYCKLHHTMPPGPPNMAKNKLHDLHGPEHWFIQWCGMICAIINMSMHTFFLRCLHKWSGTCVHNRLVQNWPIGPIESILILWSYNKWQNWQRSYTMPLISIERNISIYLSYLKHWFKQIKTDQSNCTGIKSHPPLDIQDCLLRQIQLWWHPDRQCMGAFPNIHQQSQWSDGCSMVNKQQTR